MYAVKEIYYTIQGEGFHTGRPAVFCRFSGCNLWSGREEDRHKAICKFCDTDFWGTDGLNGGKYEAENIAQICSELWPDLKSNKLIICTGGEPALQLDKQFIDTLHQADFEIAIETNGTLALPEGIDWICMSPKANTDIVIDKGHELKLIYPQKGISPKDVESLDFEHFYLQPMDSPDLAENRIKSINYCKNNPKWKLSLQIHKVLNIP
jgi:7-carboxy-7-deazaguanine synthase (Cx14CxxC type)